MSILGTLGLGVADTAVNTASSLFGAKKQDYYQRRQMSIAQDYQKELMGIQNNYQIGLMNHQNDQQLKMWNLQNEYNSPSAQVQRLRDAGLNPALVYGNGNALTPASSMSAASGSASGGSAPSNSGSSVSMPKSNLMQSYLMSIQGDSYRAGIRRTEEDIQVLREQANKLRTEQLLDLANVDARKLGNRLLRDTFDEEVKRVRIANEESQQRIAQSQSTEAVNYKTLEEIDARIAEKAAHVRSLDASSRLSHVTAYMQELISSYFLRTGFMPSASQAASWVNELGSGFNVTPKKIAKAVSDGGFDFLKGVAGMNDENIIIGLTKMFESLYQSTH